MIQLTQQEKEFIQTILKPFLKKNDWTSIRKKLQMTDRNVRKNIYIFFIENDLPILSGLSVIPKELFNNTPISHIIIPKNIKTIEEAAFMNCQNLTSVIIEDGVTTIKANAFADTALTSISLPESIEYIGTGAFRNSNLQQINIPDKITDLLTGTFDGCSDNLVIYANSRKNLPAAYKLRVPTDEVDFYKQHLKLKIED